MQTIANAARLVSFRSGLMAAVDLAHLPDDLVERLSALGVLVAMEVAAGEYLARPDATGVGFVWESLAQLAS